ncbi:MAG: hypothetical protein JNL83_18480 [Myxococcales bacterium]|nr:hypothetical protein [Myxococcales bacterium]
MPTPFSRLVAVTLSFALAGGAASRPAFADDDKPRKSGVLDGHLRQDGLGIELGAIMQGGRTEFASNNLGLSPASQGIVLRDRNGMTARMVIGLLIAVGGAMAASGPKSVSSRSYVSGNYIVTETTTTYYSEEEKRQMRENTSKAIGSVFASKYSDMELHLYSRDRFGFGDTSGYKLNFYIGSGTKVAFETGFGFGKVNSIVDNAGVPTKLSYKYLGMPFRLSSVRGPLRLALTYEWNWYKYGVEDVDRQVHLDMMGNAVADVTSHPWHFDVSTVAFKRVSLMGGVTMQEIQKPKNVGYFLQAGVMF